MSIRKVVGFISIAVCLHIPSLADDTDIYLNAGPDNGSEPLVMLTLDYRDNLGSNLCTEVSPKDINSACGQLLGDAYPFLDTGAGKVILFDAMRAVYATLFAELKDVKVGFMMNHDNTCNGNNSSGPSAGKCSNGGYILQGFRSFNIEDTNYAKRDLLIKLAAIPIPETGKGHSFQGKELYFELYRYLTGGGIYNGHLGWDDFGLVEKNNKVNLNVDGSAFSWDTSIEGGFNYKHPYQNANEFLCSRTFAVNVMFLVSNQEDNSDSAIQAPLASGGMNISGNITFPEVIEFMYDSDMASGLYGQGDIDGNQNLVSYFIADQVNNTTNGFAIAGGTKGALPLSQPSVFLDDLREIFRQILATSTTFVAASIPVNVFNRSDVVPNAYIAQFSVDEDGLPRWSGNLKKLKLQEETDNAGSKTLTLVDAVGNAAIAPDGRIVFDALTYWTNGALLPPPLDGEVAGADGRAVERGGAGQKIPGFLASNGSIGDNNVSGTRTLYAEPASGDTAMMNLGTDNAALLASDLGVSTTDATNLIRWIRGIDVDDEDGDGSSIDVRPWILGAPLHSRPLPINYGARPGGYTETNPDIRILMGAEDGFMHMFSNTSAAGNESGIEDWAFMPREVMPTMQQLRTNAASTAHPYTVDGAPVAYIKDTDGDGTIGVDRQGNVDTSDEVFAFFGLRRGGNAYYALDITNPDQPTFKWALDNSGDFAELGMSFSTPRVGTVKFGPTATPAIIFAGGYDTNKDTTAGDDSSGNAIYVVDADTGALIWKTIYGATTGAVSLTEYHHSGMVDSIPSDIAAVDANNDGNIDRLYVGDSGGTVWRVDLPESIDDRRDTTWFTTELANLGMDDITPVAATNDRRFFHRPDFVPSKDTIGAFDGVIIGSGDRADPKGIVASNWLYMIKDRNTVSGVVPGTTPINQQATGGGNNYGLGDITNTCIIQDVCTADLSNGWKLGLEAIGEKSLSTAVTAFGSIFFTTYLPEGEAINAGTNCAPSEGTGRLYAVNIFTGAPVNNYDSSDGSDVILEKRDRFRPLASGGIPAQVVGIGGETILPPDLTPESTGGRAYWKTFWLEKDIDSVP